MKRIVFASIEFVYDFDTEKEANEFIISRKNKG